MKLISLLLALLVVAFIVKSKLDSSNSSSVADSISSEGISTPKVPTSQKDLQKFEDDMNQFMQDVETDRAKKLNEILGN